jgi:dienelactone hydrolase
MDTTADHIAETDTPRYQPFGWDHWPAHKWMSYQFRRVLGESAAGGGAVSECFRTISRIAPGDREGWYQQWRTLADSAHQRGDAAEHAGHLVTAREHWLRAANYYRAAEFWLAADDPRRLPTFTGCEDTFTKAGRYLQPAAERVSIPYEGDAILYGYFLPAPQTPPRAPVLIAFGGLDSFKEELYFMVARGVLERGISCLLVDGPGQGATLRREHISTRYDYEVPVGRCIDYLATRTDVDQTRIAVSGSSLGGYYAARAACFEPRLAAAISHGAIWDFSQLARKMVADAGEEDLLAESLRWVFDSRSVAETIAKAADFRVEHILERMRCPYLILHGAHDVFDVDAAERVYKHARDRGVDVTLRMLDAEDTGAEHCQQDNSPLGMAVIGDWLSDRFGIDQHTVLATPRG